MSRAAKFMSVLAAYPKRLFNKVAFSATVIDSKIDKTSVIHKKVDLRYSSIGRYSYVGGRTGIVHAKIGHFSSIVADFAIGGASHPIDWVSSSPVFMEDINILKKNFAKYKFNPYKETIIENDV